VRILRVCRKPIRLFFKTPIKVLDRWKANKLSESEILEHLCLKLTKYKEDEVDGIFPQNDEEQMWKNKNIIDLARMGKMDHFITNPIIQSDLQSCFHGVFRPIAGTFTRVAAFALSFISLGFLAPFLLRYEKQIQNQDQSWTDMKLWKDMKIPEVQQTGPRNPDAQTAANAGQEDDCLVDGQTNTKFLHNVTFWTYVNHVGLFHQSPRTKIAYSLVTEDG